MRLIDADEAIKLFNEMYCANCDNYNGVKCRACYMKDGADVYDYMPTVDAIEVVRCKDCKRRGSIAKCPLILRTFDNYEDVTNDDDFCSRGEKKG